MSGPLLPSAPVFLPVSLVLLLIELEHDSGGVWWSLAIKHTQAVEDEGDGVIVGGEDLHLHLAAGLDLPPVRDQLGQERPRLEPLHLLGETCQEEDEVPDLLKLPSREHLVSPGWQCLERTKTGGADAVVDLTLL